MVCLGPFTSIKLLTYIATYYSWEAPQPTPHWGNYSNAQQNNHLLAIIILCIGCEWATSWCGLESISTSYIHTSHTRLYTAIRHSWDVWFVQETATRGIRIGFSPGKLKVFSIPRALHNPRLINNPSHGIKYCIWVSYGQPAIYVLYVGDLLPYLQSHLKNHIFSF